jgi:hypothetical protein
MSGSAGSKPVSCGEGTVAQNGKCVAADAGTSGPVKRPIGSACETNADCASSYCATGETSPGGLCTIVGCNMDNPCPVGSTCYRVDKTLNICMPYCDTASECRTDDGYNCQPLFTNAINICAPSCALTGACPSGTNCNATSGLCELAGCDPIAAQSACADSQTCYPDARGLTAQGGLCLQLCDPNDPKASCKVDEKDEVCQPLAEDPANLGFCAPPVCSKSEECPAGAVCQDRVCHPPALCDGNGACADDGTTCVGGKCMAKCPTASGESCAGIHPGLVCAAVLAVPACLPVGTFPGSACRSERGPDGSGGCSALTVGTTSAPMVCENDVCLVDCGTGGTELCAAVNADLVCATGIFSDALCLPKGAFPGGPCAGDDSCAQDLDGNPAVDMKCLGGSCVIDCDESSEWPGYGDALCAVVDASLTCANAAGGFCTRGCSAQGCAEGFSCFDEGDIPGDENACLPTGTFPGSPCRASGATVCDPVAGVPQHCAGGTCVLECGAAGDAAADDTLCAAFDPALTCAESAGDICVFACGAGGECPTGFACLGQGAENACLPIGTFPGSPCRPDGSDDGSAPDCDQDLGGSADADMVCIDGACVVECSTGGSSAQEDEVCSAISELLTCAESAGDLCVLACGAGGSCPTGYACLANDGEDACLPTGTFPGSPCRPDGTDDGSDPDCDQDLNGNPDADMICENAVCVVECRETTGDAEALCDSVSDVLTCSETAGNLCVRECDDGSCDEGFSCLAPGDGNENACLPDGTFPGSACRTTGAACDLVQGLFAMICVDDVCVLDCSLPASSGEVAGDGYCAGLDPRSTCSETADHVCVLACEAGACADGYSCLDPGEPFVTENACLPDGSFPGSACAGPSDECASIPAQGSGSPIAMACVAQTCAIPCVGSNDGQRDAYCTSTVSVALGTDMTCSESAGNICVPECDGSACPSGMSCLDEGGEDACLPNGTFPFSECRGAGTACDSLTLPVIGVLPMQCTLGLCAPTCPGNSDEICQAIDASLTCSNAADGLCVPTCDNGVCDAGFSCLFPGANDECLPTGSFPGSPCRAASPRCDVDVLGIPAADMVCSTANGPESCIVPCTDNNDALCGQLDISLTCFDNPAPAGPDFCAVKCQGPSSDVCPPGYACNTTFTADGPLCFPN